jgi:ProP effector
MSKPNHEHLDVMNAQVRALAELFPAAFVFDWSKPHKPLKRQINQDLIERGILKLEECRPVFRFYCNRLMYQRCLAAGGPRYDLDGQPCGEVTDEEIQGAQAMLARIQAKRAERAKASRAAKKAQRAAERDTLTKPTMPAVVGPAAEPPAPASAAPTPTPAPAPRRLGLADLKQAAQARKATAAA